jgi:hypothetical protein
MYEGIRTLLIPGTNKTTFSLQERCALGCLATRDLHFFYLPHPAMAQQTLPSFSLAHTDKQGPTQDHNLTTISSRLWYQHSC